MPYNSNLILLVNFGRYNKKRKNPPSVDQIPLIDFHGFSYLGFLKRLENIAEYDREQIGYVEKAYEEFPVKVKCRGEGGSCKEVAGGIVIPWEYVHKHDKQSGPEWRKQLYPERMELLCPEHAEEFEYNFSGGSREKGVEIFPISFSILEEIENDWNLDRSVLHKNLKRIAYKILTQGLEIENVEALERMVIDIYQAKKIVNTLLKIPKQPNLFGRGSEYKTRNIKRLKRGPGGTSGQLKINF